MTCPPEDQPTMWFKQVPRNDPNAEGVWSQKLLDDHMTVQRSRHRPSVVTDAVHLQNLKLAAEAVLRPDRLRDPEFKRLHTALADMDEWKRP